MQKADLGDVKGTLTLAAVVLGWCWASHGGLAATPQAAPTPQATAPAAKSGAFAEAEMRQIGLPDREPNMIEFTTRTLRYLRDAIKDTPAK